MSKTAEQLANEGDQLDDENKKQEAIKCFDEAIALDPNYGRAYYLKGWVEGTLGHKDKAVELYEKAVSLGYHHDGQAYYNLGNEYKNRGKDELAIEKYNMCLAIKPNKADATENKGDCLMRLNRIEESVACYKRALEIKPEVRRIYPYLGLLLEQLGRKDEAMKAYEDGISRNPSDIQSNYFKANLLAERGQREEAVKYYQVNLDRTPPFPGVIFNAANNYLALGQKDLATQYYKRAELMQPKNAMDYYNRGRCYSILGEKEKAIVDFKKAQELLRNDHSISFAPSFVKLMKDSLDTIVATEDTVVKVQEAMNQLSQDNPLKDKFTMNVHKLLEQKQEIQTKLMNNVDRNKDQEARETMSQLDQLKLEFSKQLAEMQKMQGHMTSLDNKVQKMENSLNDMKEELDNKMDDFGKKLDSELRKQDLNEEDITKLKGYFKAFVGTISSIQVTSQVIGSGQVQIDARSSAATLLSTLASFAPMFGDTLSSGITSVAEFLKSKEMITNARRIKGMAPDASALSQLIGNTALEVLKDKKKQQEILKMTAQDLRKFSGNTFQKILKFCENLQEKVDAYSYTQLYSTPAERVGHNDANLIIEKWLKGKVDPYEVQKQFVEIILNANKQEAGGSTNSNASDDKKSQTARTSCCNVF